MTITKVSKVDENTTKIKGHANSYGGAKRFDFDISKWKKTIKDGKDIKSEAIEIKDNDNGYKDISIVYYYDSSTLEITLKSNYGTDFLFKGTKQP
ncbi:unknown [Brachyspira sp. CAG:700]|nr:unknown [Brachyspira sp. CAG:700]